jgi:hypothetical protein
MKKGTTERDSETLEGELLPEYRFDYSASRPNRFAGQAVTVQLDADVAASFPTAEAVNTALRALLGASPSRRRGALQQRPANNEMYLTRSAIARRRSPRR